MADEIDHRGETAWIIGKGPSLLNVTRDMIGPGPVVTLNQAITYVRKLALPNLIYAFHKDGCISHGPAGYVPEPPGHVCQQYVVHPEPPEIALFSTHESPHCMEWYEPRMVIDVVSLGINWYTPSSPTATKLLIGWGIAEIVYVAHDAHTTGDLRRVDDGETVTDASDGGYVGSGRLAQQFADEAGIPTRYLTP